jgi:hypothetical protein
MGEKPQPGGYGSQRRWIEHSARIVGLSEAIKPFVVEELVEQLEVNGLEHHKAREQYGLASGLVQRGKAILSVLNLIRFGDDLCVRLMAAGTLGGCWGRVVLWDSKFNRRLSPLSRVGRASRSPPFI